MITRSGVPRSVRTALWAVCGGAFAALFYAIERAGRGYAVVVVGAVLGGLLALAADFYRRNARLTEVRITVPQLSELTFVVNDDKQQVSWQLFVESVTRISTQRLEGDGLIREALDSLYSLFTTTREILRATRPTVPGKGGQGITVEYLAVTMLNRELRPFLSTWHPRLREFEEGHPELPESAWPRAAECRAALGRVQAETREYVVGFARLAGVRDPELLLGGMVDPVPPQTPRTPGTPQAPQTPRSM